MSANYVRNAIIACTVVFLMGVGFLVGGIADMTTVVDPTVHNASGLASSFFGGTVVLVSFAMAAIYRHTINQQRHLLE